MKPPADMTQQLRDRDEHGLEALPLHYGPLLRCIIRPILDSPQDREECLSEVTLRVWEKIGQYDPSRGSWTAWLTAIARNTALNHARRSAKWTGTEELTGRMPDKGRTPEKEILRRERQHALEQALRRMHDRDVQIFYRKYYYCQSTTQIAAELGMTTRAVEGKLYRIRNKLRKVLGGDDHA